MYLDINNALLHFKFEEGRDITMKPFIRFTGIVAVIIFGFLSILGSGGGGDDVEGTPQGGITAFNFTAGNTFTAAQLAASAMSFFPLFTNVGQIVLTTLATSDPNNSPFDLMICNNAGSSILSWNDIDTSGDISVGDVALLTFTNCDIDGSGATATGTVSFIATSVDADPLPNSVGLTVAVNLTINAAPDTATLKADFGVISSTTNNVVFTNDYTANDPSGQKLTISENGTTLFQFGCFNVSQTFDIAVPGTYSLSPNGVINASNRIMSLAGGPALTFVNDAMNAGTKRLLSLAVPGCDALGVLNGVGDSNGSYLDMEALSGGNIRLHTYDSNNYEFYTEDTTWNALIN